MKASHSPKRPPRVPAEVRRVPPTAQLVHDAETKQDSGSLQRGLAILDTIIKAERPLTSAEIAESVSLSPSTTHRLLKTLVELGLVFRDSLKRYYPCARALFPANLFHPLNVLRRITIEQLVSLRQQFGLAASCLIFLGGKRWVLETVHGHDTLSPYNDIEVSAPLHASVTGKILLSTLEPAEREKLIGAEPYNRHTPRTLTTREALDRDLAQITLQGHASAFDEMLLGLSAIGAPIWCAPNRPLGAIVLAGPSRYFSDTRNNDIVSAVTQAAGLLSFASPDVRAVCRFLGH